jgi:hypothetical protein
MQTLHLLKLWVTEERKTINHRSNMGMMSPVEARSKMELLDKMWLMFQLEKLEVTFKFHKKI